MIRSLFCLLILLILAGPSAGKDYRSMTLAELVARKPDSTLEELRRQLRLETKVEVSISTIWRGLERIEFTQKKDPARARG